MNHSLSTGSEKENGVCSQPEVVNMAWFYDFAFFSSGCSFGGVWEAGRDTHPYNNLIFSQETRFLLLKSTALQGLLNP